MNPLTNLAADTYTFVATDAQGCTSLPLDIEIMEPQDLLIDAVNVIQQASCNSTCDAIIDIQDQEEYYHMTLVLMVLIMVIIMSLQTLVRDAVGNSD